MFRSKRMVSIILGATLFAALVLGGSAFAQEEKHVQLDLTPSRDSGVSGTATLTDVEGGVKVELHMRGLSKAGVKHNNHIHGGGTCADDRAFILLHAKAEKGQGVPPGISCADLPQESANNTTFESLPSSGGMPPTALLVVSLVLLAATTSATLMVLHRV